MSGADIAEVVNVVNFYPIIIDSQQWHLLDRIFTPDITTDFGGPAVFSGLENIRTLFDAIHAPFEATQHATRSHHVTVDGDTATCISYVHAQFLRSIEGTRTLFESTGWYDDVLVRTSAGWRISKRTCRTIWSGGDPRVLQTTPDVHVEEVFNSLRGDVAAGEVGHFAALERLPA